MVRRFPAIHAGSNLLFDPHNPNRPVNFDVVQFHPDRRDKPLHWRKPRRIGVSFTGDLFDEQVPIEWIDDIMAIIADGKSEKHQFFILTKQPGNMERMLREYHIHLNTWLGISICDQEDADQMIPELLRVPGKHWVSWEPALGPVDLSDYIWVRMAGRDGLTWAHGFDFIVLGAESGPKRRPCPIEWMVVVVEQCRAAGVPVYVKQLDIGGKVVHDINLFPEALKVRELP